MFSSNSLFSFLSFLTIITFVLCGITHFSLFQDLFTRFLIVSAYETTLSANRKLSHVQRIIWKSDDVSSSENIERDGSSQMSDIDIHAIDLYPMQIRTFILKVDYLEDGY